MVLEAAQCQTNESQKDADHAKDLLHGVFLFEENESVTKADNRSSSSDSRDDCDHGIGVLESEHIDIIAQNEKYRDEYYGPYIRDVKSALGRMSAMMDVTENDHHETLIEGVIDLYGVVVV